MSNRAIIEAIGKLAAATPSDRVTLVIAKVDSVNEENRTCDVSPIDDNADTSIPDVSLLIEDSNGMLLIPVIGSTVAVMYNKRGIAFVALCSELKKVECYAELFQFNDGGFGGLTKTPELKTGLTTNNDILTKLLQMFESWTPVAGDGGLALKTLATQTLTGLTVGNFSNIENEKVKHG